MVNGRGRAGGNMFWCADKPGGVGAGPRGWHHIPCDCNELPMSGLDRPEVMVNSGRGDINRVNEPL